MSGSATNAVKASLVMQAAMSSMSTSGPKKLHPSPFALPPAVLEEMKRGTGIEGESNAAALASYLARGHQNYDQPAPEKKKVPIPVSQDSLLLEASIKERALRSLIDDGRLETACLYCGKDGSLQLQLIKMLLQRRMFVEAGRSLTTFLLRFHQVDACVAVAQAVADGVDVAAPPGTASADSKVVPSSKLSGFLGAGQIAPSLPFEADAARLSALPSTAAPSIPAASLRTINPDYRLGGQISLCDIYRFSQEKQSAAISNSSMLLGTAGGTADDTSKAAYPGASIQPSWSVPLTFRPELSPSPSVPFYDEKASVLLSSSDAEETGSDTSYSKSVIPVTCVKSLLRMREIIHEEQSRMESGSGSSVSSSPLPLFVVGVDCEWRPNHIFPPLQQPNISGGSGSGGGSWPAALLQIATPFSVFLVDLLALHALATDTAATASSTTSVIEAVETSIGYLFKSHSVPKIGFNLHGDIRKLTHTHPLFASSFERCESVLELGAVLQGVADYWQAHSNAASTPSAAATTLPASTVDSSHPHSSSAEPLPPAVVEKAEQQKMEAPLAPLWLLHLAPTSTAASAHHHHHHHHPFHSLSIIAEQVLGFSLNKKQQTSDWQSRPFTVEQLVYASLDALVLVEVVKEALRPIVGLSASRGRKAGSDDLSDKAALAAMLMSVAQVIAASPAESSAAATAGPHHHHAHHGLDYRVTLRGEAACTTVSAQHAKPTTPAPTPVAASAGVSEAPEEAGLLGPAAVRAFLLSEQAKGKDAETKDDDVTFMLLPAPPSTTAEGGADVLGIPSSLVIKTLSMMATVARVPHNAGKKYCGDPASSLTMPVIALVRGDCKFNYKKMEATVLAWQKEKSEREEAAALAASSDASEATALKKPAGQQWQCKVRLATLDECKRVFGYVPGSFPPCGHREVFPTFIDSGIPSVLSPSQQLLYGGGGSPTMKLRMTWKQLLRYCLVAGGSVADLVATPAAAATAAATPVQDAGVLSDIIVASTASILDLDSLLIPYDLPPLSFIVDGMLGRLCRWLRVIGVDAESTVGPGAIAYLEEREQELKKSKEGSDEAAAAPSDEAVTAAASSSSSSSERVPPKGVSRGVYATRVMSISDMVAWSRATGKILVTRDRKVAAAKMLPGPIYWLNNQDTQEGFEELTEHFSITVSPDNLMSRW
jgi:uncharacterized protein with PIN domain/prolyl-tRNA editing enzyme YbaK/EbsC (Cys-tRNA(Pro) deacylase)